MMNVYLAGRFSRLPELVQYADQLESLGIHCTSRWLRGGHEWVGTSDDDIPVDRLAQFAQEDLDDLNAADVLVCFTESPRTGPARGGRHVEMGYALAKGKAIVVVGHYENVFYCLPHLWYVEGWDHALQFLINAEASGMVVPLPPRFRIGDWVERTFQAEEDQHV